MSTSTDQSAGSSEASMNRSSSYKKFTLREHIHEISDTYAGSSEPLDETVWVLDGNNKMVQKDLTYIPVLYKIFDEILVNAADNKIRDPTTDTIKITVTDDGEITVFNNGRGIPVEKHSTEDMYVPQMIFGELLTSSSYGKDNKGKLVSSRNGVGAKLTNIFSKEFTVETYDKETGLKYKQTWFENMTVVNNPKITKNKSIKSDYTQITFKPDLERFNLTHLDEDHRALFKRRVYDLTATVRGVKVYFNGELIKIKSFKEYINLFLQDDDQVIYEQVNPRWEIAVVPNDSGQFQQISFVNSINTKRGGSHVDVVTKLIIDKVMEKVKKISKGSTVRPITIKSNMWLFVNCLIEDPSFDSQTKETLTSAPKNWGSYCDPSGKFFEKICKSKVVSSTLEALQNKEAQLLKRTDGAKRNTITGIPKLDDANRAGTREAYKCTLLLTEGDSAKTTALAGISVLSSVERQYYGVYPLRGKVLNVRDASTTQVLQNKEITELKQILGLQTGKEYTDVKSLRYGKVALFTDADSDGSHIKGLIINLLDHFYPSLLKLDDFLFEFITPIVKCTKGTTVKVFYNLQEHETWLKSASINGGKGWAQKYLKGLGSSTKKDAQDYFKDLPTHLKSFKKTNDQDREKLDMVFNKKRASDRKAWLGQYNPDSFLDKRQGKHSVSDFIDKELVHFSQYDNVRSIPKVTDGLKPSQRKVLFSTFKRPIEGEIKVAQLGPRVAEMSAYHHGEVSLFQTIIKMAQDFCGSNNLNLFQPIGQFGSRREGGSDAASPRYIFTKLQKYTRLIFHQDDDAILPSQIEEGMHIEPKYYLPIVPMALVNGATGIGSGYSTDVPSYKLQDIIACLRQRLSGGDVTDELTPWFKGFKGTITQNPVDHHKWTMRGLFTKNGKTITITELPVGTWIDPYRVDHLEGKLLKTGIVTDVKSQCTDEDVYFEILLKDDNMTDDQIVSTLKLETTFHTSNMVLFDNDLKLKRYANPTEIMNDYYQVRLDGYVKRKAHLQETLEETLQVLHNKKRFIDNVVNGTLVVQAKPVDQVTQDLETMGFNKYQNNFNYLLDLSIRTLTKERVVRLTREYEEKTRELEELRKKSPETLWNDDLSALEGAL